MIEKNPKLVALFKELQKEKEKILEEVKPARETYETLINDPRLLKAMKTIKENSKRLMELDNEIAGIAKALGSKVMKLETGEFK